jgi:hypothetical protein
MTNDPKVGDKVQYLRVVWTVACYHNMPSPSAPLIVLHRINEAGAFEEIEIQSHGFKGLLVPLE